MLDSSSRSQQAAIPNPTQQPEHIRGQTDTLRSVQYGDIPGTRYQPDDGRWPRNYRYLSEPELSAVLDEYAEPASAELEGGLRADALNFQPFRRKASQDRYVIEQWDIDGQLWTMTGVFDGMFLSFVVQVAFFCLLSSLPRYKLLNLGLPSQDIWVTRSSNILHATFLLSFELESSVLTPYMVLENFLPGLSPKFSTIQSYHLTKR